MTRQPDGEQPVHSIEVTCSRAKMCNNPLVGAADARVGRFISLSLSREREHLPRALKNRQRGAANRKKELLDAFAPVCKVCNYQLRSLFPRHFCGRYMYTLLLWRLLHLLYILGWAKCNKWCSLRDFISTHLIIISALVLMRRWYFSNC